MPRIRTPDRIDAFCGSKQARPTSLASVMTSTNDKLLADRPSGAGVRSEIEAAGGVIGYWQDQPLLLPQTALALGETDGYVHVRAAAVPIVPDGSLSRNIYFQVEERGAPRWIALEAFDVQNVCVEGRRED